MKHLIISSLLALSFSSFANDLTSNQESEVVSAIDNICGDSWCEGDFNFDFHSLDCNFKTQECGFSFDLIWYEYGNDDSDEPTETIVIPYQCTLKNIASFEQMVENRRYGYDLKWDFYETVSDCISDGESFAYDQLD